MPDQPKVSTVIERLRAAAAPTWKDQSWDGLQSGSLDAPVKGVAVAWAPTLDVLKQAVAHGSNLILTKDPNFWYEDETPRTSVDSSTSRVAEGMAAGSSKAVVIKTDLSAAKKKFIESNNLNIYRISENWYGKTSMASEGLLNALGWKASSSISAVAPYPEEKTAIVTLPAQPLLALSKSAKAKFACKSARLLGAPTAKIAKIAVHPGYLTIAAITEIAKVPNLDLILTGEACEWEAFVYAEDWINAGHGKGFLMLGLAVTSDAAASGVAAWVKKTLTGIPVESLHVGDPFQPVFAGRLRA